ncbi:MAG: hypothetical protein KDE09_26270, partial [Anaerolineales bacterium]|nr:hypothetical protein [Anaerolineales bacterium]
EQLSGLVGAINLGNYGPTDQATAVYDVMAGEIDEQMVKFGDLLEGELDDFNQKLSGAGVIGVMPG